MAIDWSFDQFHEAEQVLFRRLCVFAARFTLEDVVGVCASDGATGSEALDLLAALVDKSLVTKEDVKGIVCYRLHETMREYARLKLHDADEEDLLQEHCLEHYRSTCLRSNRSAVLHLGGDRCEPHTSHHGQARRQLTVTDRSLDGASRLTIGVLRLPPHVAESLPVPQTGALWPN